MSRPLVSMVPQRHMADCGVSVLSMFLRISYEEALLAVGKEAPKVLGRGLWFTQLRRAARRLGVRTRIKRTWRANADDGIVYIKNQRGPNHCVLLRRGLFFDTDFNVYDPSDYLKATKARTGALLVRAEV